MQTISEQTCDDQLSKTRFSLLLRSPVNSQQPDQAKGVTGVDRPPPRLDHCLVVRADQEVFRHRPQGTQQFLHLPPSFHTASAPGQYDTDRDRPLQACAHRLRNSRAYGHEKTQAWMQMTSSCVFANHDLQLQIIAVVRQDFERNPRRPSWNPALSRGTQPTGKAMDVAFLALSHPPPACLHPIHNLCLPSFIDEHIVRHTDGLPGCVQNINVIHQLRIPSCINGCNASTPKDHSWAGIQPTQCSLDGCHDAGEEGLPISFLSNCYEAGPTFCTPGQEFLPELPVCSRRLCQVRQGKFAENDLPDVKAEGVPVGTTSLWPNPTIPKSALSHWAFTLLPFFPSLPCCLCASL
jgi:hypothetical protein